MTTLEDYKQGWHSHQQIKEKVPSYDLNSYTALVRKRARGPVNRMMQYFWASLAYQIILYSFYSHVIVAYWGNGLLVGLSMAGILIYIPFTYMLMTRFKSAANAGMTDASDKSLREHVLHQYETLSAFYRFKRRNEWAIVLISSTLGVSLFFELYFGGGLIAHLPGALITFAITLCLCAAAIWSENNKRFERPLANLAALLAEFGIDDE